VIPPSAPPPPSPPAIENGLDPLWASAAAAAANQAADAIAQRVEIVVVFVMGTRLWRCSPS
jgi:hypothetical protein